MAVNKTNISSDWTLECVTCPYDKTHRVLPHRLVLHMHRCARNYCGAKLVRCPFNISHVLTVSDMENHIFSCLDGASLRFQNPDKLPPQKPEVSYPQMNLTETTQDWDKEPDVPSYDPSIYCKNNPIVRSIRGESASVRREFRELERKRFRSFFKESGSESVGVAPNKVTDICLDGDDQLEKCSHDAKDNEIQNKAANNK